MNEIEFFEKLKLKFKNEHQDEPNIDSIVQKFDAFILDLKKGILNKEDTDIS